MKLRYFIIPLVYAIMLAGCAGENKKKQPQTAAKFVAPDVPATINAPQDRAAYLSLHYWDHFDFADTTFIGKPEITEQALADYIQMLGIAPYPKAEEGIAAMLGRAMAGDSAMFAHIAELYGKYLYDPNSPMRNEELYIPVLRYIIASDKVSDLDKTVFRYRFETALKNRPGETAADFTYTLANGRQARLSQIKSQYTIIFFNNPDCHDCARVKEFISQSPALSNNPDITILAVYPDKDLDLWRKVAYPDGWINAYDKDGRLKDETVYDLKAIPCLYLLDADKKILLKDAYIEEIEQYIVHVK